MEKEANRIVWKARIDVERGLVRSKLQGLLAV